MVIKENAIYTRMKMQFGKTSKMSLKTGFKCIRDRRTGLQKNLLISIEVRKTEKN